MKQKILIINADDCNLTSQVTEAILKAHENGIVTSTTFLINLPVGPDVVRELLARKKLGIGLHLNVTLGKTAAKPELVKSLLQKDGRFKKKDEYSAKKLPPVSEILEEFKAQLLKFVKVFKRLPTHVDVHHHMHDFRPFLEALAAPFAGLGHDFTFDLGQGGPGLGLGTSLGFRGRFGFSFHVKTRQAW